MRAVLQRVSRAKVIVEDHVTGEVGLGFLVLLGVGKGDTDEQGDRLLDKIVGLRVFEDEAEKMNLSLTDVGGGLLIVSQFTLYADTRKGRRPSFTDAALPEDGRRLYDSFVEKAKTAVETVGTGEFGAMMDVELVNDGPVTIVLDTDNFK